MKQTTDSPTTFANGTKRMNDPKMAEERRKAVKNAQDNDVPKEDAYSWVQEHYGRRFEGHLLDSTIDWVYDD